MRIAIGCDEAGYSLKEGIKPMLVEMGYEVTDHGVYDESPSLYPEVGFAVAEAVAAGRCDRGILICGTGIGMAITANKVPGIRAAVCHDAFSTERSRKSNDAQVMCMGARVIAPEMAKYLLKLWLSCDFEGGGSIPKVEKIKEYERSLHKEG